MKPHVPLVLVGVPTTLIMRLMDARREEGCRRQTQIVVKTGALRDEVRRTSKRRSAR